MKIYKGDAAVELTLDNFLDLLEDDALEDVINMVLDLEATGSIKGKDFDGEIVYLGAVDMDDLDDYDDIEGLFDHITDGLENYEIISVDDFENIFGADSLLGAAFLDDEDILDNLYLSNEDLRIKRIVQRFRHIEDASR